MNTSHIEISTYTQIQNEIENEELFENLKCTTSNSKSTTAVWLHCLKYIHKVIVF